MTLAEVWVEFAAAAERDRDRQDRDISAVWTSAALMRRQKLPTLKSLLSVTRTAAKAAVPQSAAQMKNVLRILSAQYDMPLRHGGARG